jgi:hypothetical protein
MNVTTEEGEMRVESNLGLQNAESISPSQQNAIERIATYPFGFVVKKLVADGVIPDRLSAEAETELRRFFALVALDIAPLAMIGPVVDEVWHQFVLFTPQYRRFCLDTLGFFVDHQPDTDETPIPIEAGKNFVNGYRKHFGEIPAVWFEGMTPETVEYYNEAAFRTRPPMRWSGWTGR